MDANQQMMERSMRSVFVGNIPFDLTEEKLKEIFSEVGPVLSFKLVYDRESGKPKGYGFCEYKDIETAGSALRNLNGYEIGGRILKVDNAANEKTRLEMQNLMNEHASATLENSFENVDPEQAPEAISKAVASLPPEQMFELMKQMKQCVQNNPTEARAMLLQNPQLAYALLQAQVVLRLVDPHSALTLLHKANVVDVLQIGEPKAAVQSIVRPEYLQPPMPINMPNVESVERPLDPRMARLGFGMGDIDLRAPPGPVMPPIQNQPILPLQQENLGRDPRQLQAMQIPMPPIPPPPPRDPRAMSIDQRAGIVPQPPLPRAPAPVPAPTSIPQQRPSVSSLAPGGGAASDQEKAALIMQVLKLSDEQIAMLPPEQRQSILVLKEQIAKSAQR